VVVVAGEEAGFKKRLGDTALADGEIVQRYLVWDEEVMVSLRRTVGAARQNARSIRDVLYPDSIAIVGASKDQTKRGFRAIERLLHDGYPGAIYPVNPKEPEILGLKCYPSIESVPRVMLPTISGSIPHPFNRPKGCAFHPRCPSFIPGRCDVAEPHLAAVGRRTTASCFLYE